MSDWRPIETATKEARAIQLGHWNGERWTWLTHGSWNAKEQSWMTDEPINPTHWREIGEPDSATA